jgi:starch-binding outer membrane protein, SusD/RagB family
MYTCLRRAAANIIAIAALTGCSDFLSAERAINDPNLPAVASRDQLFVGAQASVMGQQEGGIPMIACQWMQQCAGVNGRFVQQQDSYSINAGTFDLNFSEIYSAGGLVSLRKVQAIVEEEGDQVYLGIAQVLEALLIGTAADVWGDIPYSEALTDNPETPFDEQMAIYTAIQALLDEAIGNLAPSATGAGPGPADLFFGTSSVATQKAQWRAVAQTLKARFHMHTAERLGGAAYTAARTAALAGISSAANDFRTTHSGATSERNLWVQFQNTSFGPDLVAGKRLVDLMLAQNDPRIDEYFQENENDGYGGFDVTTGLTPGAEVSPLLGTGRSDPDFRQPIVTWEENQLILAEANYQLAGGGATGIVAAQPFLDAVRGAHGKPSMPATLQAIIEEKYISMFQTIEPWNDWKRTCLPQLTPALGRSTIPGRVYYGQTEEQTNENTPRSEDQNLFTVRNDNDPNGC